MANDVPRKQGWSKFDTLWMLNLFGTAVGAGILFLPITAGRAGLWPLVIITVLVWPMTYLAHRGLTRFVLASPSADSDVTGVVEEFFGHRAGIIITVLYFLASQIPPAKPGACFCEPLKAAECMGRLKAAISANSAVPNACLQFPGCECIRG